MEQRGSEWQLVFFTILIQMAVGTFILWSGAVAAFPGSNSFRTGTYPVVTLAVVLFFLILGTFSASLHLGNPISAVFSISNLRRSWLSREALLGSSFGLVCLIILIRRFLETPFSLLDGILIIAGIIVGLTLVYTISRLYMLRTVPAWNHLGTSTTFFTTSFLLGAVVVSALWLVLTYNSQLPAVNWQNSEISAISTLLILVLTVIQLGIFILTIIYLNHQGGTAAESVRLLWTRLKGVLILRLATILFGAGILSFGTLMELSPGFIFLADGLFLASEIFGRFLFYGFYQREGF